MGNDSSKSEPKPHSSALEDGCKKSGTAENSVTNIVITAPENSGGETVVKITNSRNEFGNTNSPVTSVSFANCQKQLPATVAKDNKPSAPPLTEFEPKSTPTGHASHYYSQLGVPQSSNIHEPLPPAHFNQFYSHQMMQQHSDNQTSNLRSMGSLSTNSNISVSNQPNIVAGGMKMENTRMVGATQFRSAMGPPPSNTLTADINQNQTSNTASHHESIGIYPSLPTSNYQTNSLYTMQQPVAARTAPSDYMNELRALSNLCSSESVLGTAITETVKPGESTTSNRNFNTLHKISSSIPTDDMGTKSKADDIRGLQRGHGRGSNSGHSQRGSGFLKSRNQQTVNQGQSGTSRGHGNRGREKRGERGRGRGTGRKIYQTNLQRTVSSSMESVSSNTSNISTGHVKKDFQPGKKKKDHREEDVRYTDEKQFAKLVEKNSHEGYCDLIQNKGHLKAEESAKVVKHFREFSILPTSDDISTYQEPFLQKIITKGAYSDVEHYLDTHFKLLREDFIKPLREGIKDFLKGNNSKGGDIRLYKKTVFLYPTIVSNKIGFIVCFDLDKKMQQQKLCGERLLKFGSLLSFSNNGFKDILFGIVLDNNEKYLQERQIVVQVVSYGKYNKDKLPESSFAMVESKVYFEPYHNVLRALQLLQFNDFPFRKYIISVEKCKDPPDYLISDAGISKHLTVNGMTFPALHPSSWPAPSHLKLDSYQYEAFKMAITQKFVIIQGPPGSGKTYLGLKIVNVLLQNESLWRDMNSTILVICSKTHTLDQFLEGVQQYTSNIVHLEGKSKLRPLHLKEKQKNTTRTGKMYDMLDEIKRDLSSLATRIKKLEKDIEIINNNAGILSVGVLALSMTETHLQFFKNGEGKADDEIFIRWLEEGLNFTHDRFQKEITSATVREERFVWEDAYKTDDEVPRDNELDDVGLDLDIDVLEEISLAVDFRNIEKITKDLRSTIVSVCNNGGGEFVLNQKSDLQDSLDDAERRLRYYQSNLSSNETVLIKHLFKFSNLWNLKQYERWALYKHWAKIVKNRLLEELQKKEIIYSSILKRSEELKFLVDCQALQSSLVVGVTSVGAMRQQKLLQALKSKIVIVEEAAEILESFIVTALTQHCQHLILIGDHQQLRPSTAVHQLRHQYNLDTSLFERMLKNDMHYETLKMQYRMRPEIANLIVPVIYPELENHFSLNKYQPIAGVSCNLFFVRHQTTEEEVPDVMSYINVHEGDFLIALCCYLILQGYEPQDISILTTYAGQALYIQKKQKATQLLKNVKVTCVDNFQGENNKIILLSLVRSNQTNNIGFLKMKNRVCVALSRAREALYMIGNMDCLSAGSQIWNKINEVLLSKGLIGTSLSLKCQKHPQHITEVSSAGDFLKLQGGGCRLLCNELLQCGHKCTRLCHIQDREHKEFKCLEHCTRISKRCGLHPCQKYCFEDCGECQAKVKCQLTCGHTAELVCCVDPQVYECKKSVYASLPCGHIVSKPCHQDPATVSCRNPCENHLPCGHQCLRKCHFGDDPLHLKYKCKKPCGRKNLGCREDHICEKKCHQNCSECHVKVMRPLPECQHVHEVLCSQDESEIKCQMKCDRTLPCGHPCQMLCSEPCGNCQVEVNKVISNCNHIIKLKCSVVPNPNQCKQPCRRTLPCGHKCGRRCNQPCETECKVKVLADFPSLCGHNIMIYCHLKNQGLMLKMSPDYPSFCEHPCSAMLECGHKCKGNCGSCYQGRVHVKCQEKCERVLTCGHKCTASCSENCPTCPKRCTFKCKHSKCSNKCGEPCMPCRERCTWRCEHLQCTRQCHELCDRGPCYRHCKLFLRCGHPCMGFCGDPCPPLCHICDKQQMAMAHFGNDGYKNANSFSRFVYLEDCKHTVESKALDSWLKKLHEEITLLMCPICKTPIITTQRYMNEIKNSLDGICKVRRKAFTIRDEIEKGRPQLNNELKNLLVLSNNVFRSGKWNDYMDHFKEQLFPRGKKCKQMDTESLGLHIRFLKEVMFTVRIATGGLDKNSFEKIELQATFLVTILQSRGQFLSTLEVKDINSEVERFNALVQLCRLESTQVYKTNCNSVAVQNLYDTSRRTVTSLQKFTQQQKDIFLESLNRLNLYLGNVIVVSSQERMQITKAVTLQQGHWFQCPKGHVYSLSEIGTSLQARSCHECDIKITLHQNN